ncbi:DUF2865 domain-containing protein [Hyphomicrobium sp.]|uniref:DUF2865 domain-containing protein n=1 Tax=Hyphomicrobium sp. TaxID=82 RepID=UPI0025C46429|nr:DUF2865 domain-containing protein [Hyphomicrobium sp.]MCC7252530.1 DUF2865 domain-containing protein [Hyphomicrobium sp.]
MSLALLALVLAGGVAVPALAQSWWPFGGNEQPRQRGPVPSDSVYGDPYDEGAGGQAGLRGNSVCLELEQRLVQEGQRGGDSRHMIPMVENELRQVDQAYRSQRKELDRADCYEYFLFSKTLRRTRRCVDLANQADASRRRIDDLEVQLRQLQGSSNRSYQDEIIRELARNNCGSNYQQQARRQSGGGFSGFWDDGESSGYGGGSSFGALPYATYRTVCVRLCDGYYFPVSFSTLPNHFQRDSDVCHSKCAAPAELYYHQNPGAGMEQAVAARDNIPYTQLKTAFRYRKEYVNGCSCKMAEYQPEPGAAVQQGGAGADGWAAQAPTGSTEQQPPPQQPPPAQYDNGGGETLPWETSPQ